MPLCGAALNTNTFIVMDVAAAAPQNLQVPTLLLDLQLLALGTRSYTENMSFANRYLNIFNGILINLKH